jgi:hypothetical protein
MGSTAPICTFVTCKLALESHGIPNPMLALAGKKRGKEASLDAFYRQAIVHNIPSRSHDL